MRNVLCPVYSNQGGHEDGEREPRSLAKNVFQIFQCTIDGGYDKGNGGEYQRSVSPERPFGACRECKVPRDAVYAAKNDTKDGEDNHSGKSIAVGAWGVERGNVSGASRNFVGCDDPKGGSEGERGNGEDGEEWAEGEEDEDEDEDEKMEGGGDEEEPGDGEGDRIIAEVSVQNSAQPLAHSGFQNIGEWDV